MVKRSAVLGRPGKAGKPVWLDELGANVLRLEYDFTARIGRVYMPAYCCGDMSGTIALFKRIDPGCHQVDTFAGARTDVCYQLIDGKWEALVPPQLVRREQA
jgi:hypothetical protein